MHEPWRGDHTPGATSTREETVDQVRGIGRDREMRPVRVLLADDHTLFRQGLAGVLASYEGMEVVGEVPNDAAALELARELEPDVVVMQVQVPLERAKEALRELQELPRPPKVVIVTMFEDPRYVRELMGFGANAYLLKSSSAEHLIAAMRAAVFDPDGEHVVVEMPRSMLEIRGGEGGVLSAREMEVILLAARGLSNRQISRSLHLSEATVKRHLANIYPKMGVSSRGEAARKALAENWITIEDVTE